MLRILAFFMAAAYGMAALLSKTGLMA